MAKRHPSQVRMEDVARIAGVSLITVSRTLKSPDKVAEATRKRVLAAIEKTGYIPNLVAGGLASHRTNVVGAIIPTITNSIFADTIDGMSDVFSEKGIHLLLGTSGYSLTKEEELIEAMLAQRAAALVITGATHSSRSKNLLKRVRIPVVETWTVDRNPLDIRVGFSNFDASYAMVRHLADCGYRHIGFVNAPVKANDRARARLMAYRQAVQELGLVECRGYEREASFSFHHGAISFADLLENEPQLEAVYCANDILAIGALLESQRRGLRVPDDIGIAGFDDVDLACEINPGLTTVRLPRYDIGHVAAELIVKRINQAEPTNHIADLGYEVVQRGTTRPPEAKTRRIHGKAGHARARI